MADITPVDSFAHQGILISVLVPEDWVAAEPADNLVRFFGPEQSGHNNYQPTFSIALNEPDGFGDEWFEEFCNASLERLSSGYEGFELRSTERFMLSSLVEVNAVWYQWEPEPGFAFAQVQALIPVDRYRLYLVNAATLLPLADTFLPAFDRILKSLRILPRRPRD